MSEQHHQNHEADDKTRPPYLARVTDYSMNGVGGSQFKAAPRRRRRNTGTSIKGVRRAAIGSDLAENVRRVTEPQRRLHQALGNIDRMAGFQKQMEETVRRITEPQRHLQDAIGNIDRVTNMQRQMEETIRRITEPQSCLQGALGNINRIADIQSQLDETIRCVSEPHHRLRNVVGNIDHVADVQRQIEETVRRITEPQRRLQDAIGNIDRITSMQRRLNETVRHIDQFGLSFPAAFFSSIETNADSIAAELHEPVSSDATSSTITRDQLRSAIADWASTARHEGLDVAEALRRLVALARKYQELLPWLTALLVLISVLLQGHSKLSAPSSQQLIRERRKIARENQMVTDHRTVRIHLSPKDGSQRIGTLPAGVIVERHGKQKEWIKIQWTDEEGRSRIGWARSKYLRPGQALTGGIN